MSEDIKTRLQAAVDNNTLYLKTLPATSPEPQIAASKDVFPLLDEAAIGHVQYNPRATDHLVNETDFLRVVGGNDAKEMFAGKSIYQYSPSIDPLLTRKLSSATYPDPTRGRHA